MTENTAIQAPSQSETRPRDVVLVIDAPCDWLTSNRRRHRMAEAKLVGVWRSEACKAAEGRTGFKGRVSILAFVYKPRGGRWDPGNWYPTAKACVDGLVDAGLLVDDDHEHVIGPDMRHGGKGPARLVLVISECRKDAGVLQNGAGQG